MEFHLWKRLRCYITVYSVKSFFLSTARFYSDFLILFLLFSQKSCHSAQHRLGKLSSVDVLPIFRVLGYCRISNFLVLNIFLSFTLWEAKICSMFNDAPMKNFRSVNTPVFRNHKLDTIFNMHVTAGQVKLGFSLDPSTKMIL